MLPTTEQLNNSPDVPILAAMISARPAAVRQRSLLSSPAGSRRARRTDSSLQPLNPTGHGDRGAVIVEFALVAVILFTIIFGLIEGGLLVRARNSTESATDEAARRGSIAGSSASADWQILRQMEVRGALSQAQINYVVVFRAEHSLAEPSQACKEGTPVSNECNVYERSDFELNSGAFDCGNPSVDGSWCPASRAQDETGFEYIGVHVNASHRGLTGIFGDVDLASTSVLPLEGSGGT